MRPRSFAWPCLPCRLYSRPRRFNEGLFELLTATGPKRGLISAKRSALSAWYRGNEEVLLPVQFDLDVGPASRHRLSYFLLLRLWTPDSGCCFPGPPFSTLETRRSVGPPRATDLGLRASVERTGAGKARFPVRSELSREPGPPRSC
jgi:hypothetical protein